MDHVTLVQSRAAVLAGELERLRGIGIPLEAAVPAQQRPAAARSHARRRPGGA